MQIQEIGNHGRFVVVDDHGCFWSGPLGWVPELRRARVLAERTKAEKVIRIIGQQMRDIENGKKFIAQVVVTTSSWVPLEELRETLQRHVSIITEIEGDLLLLDVAIDWESLREHHDA